MTTEALPHERVWKFGTDPFYMEPRKDFKCLFCKSADGKPGEMVVSHGQVFSFDLELHGDYEGKKRSHAIDTWMYCWDCKWTVVHGVAIPEDVFEAFGNMVLNMPSIDAKGEVVKEGKKDEKLEIPKGMSMTIMPHDETKETRRPAEVRWDPVFKPIGLEPNFPMTCKMCGWEGNMFLRHSKMHLVKREVEKKSWKIPFTNATLRLFRPLTKPTLVPAFRISYKCPQCDWLATFVPPDEKTHFNSILEIRGGQVLYYPSPDELKSEDPLIARKLEDLGYI